MIRKTLERIRETLGEDSQGFAKPWERICKDLPDFRRGFARIHETLGEDSQGFAPLPKSRESLRILSQNLANPHESLRILSQSLMNPCESSQILSNPLPKSHKSL